MSLKNVQSGQPMRIQAKTFNMILEATRAVRQQQQSGGRSTQADAPHGASTIWIRNDGADPVHLGDGLYPLDPVIGPAENLGNFLEQPVFSCDTSAGPDPTDRFLIAAEPIAVGKIGRAVATGVCPARIYLDDPQHRFVVMTSQTDRLRSSITGGAQILWIEEWTVGVQWALVRLGLPLQEKPLPDGVLAEMHYVLKNYGGVLRPTWDFSVLF